MTCNSSFLGFFIKKESILIIIFILYITINWLLKINRSCKFLKFTFVLTAKIFFTTFIWEPNVYVIKSLIIWNEKDILIQSVFENICELFVMKLMEEILSSYFMIIMDKIHLPHNKSKKNNHDNWKFRCFWSFSHKHNNVES